MTKKMIDKLQNVEGVGLFVTETMGTHGWKLLINEVTDKLDSLQDRIELSNDPNEVFACTKEKNGILFLITTAKDLSGRGETATLRLNQLSK